MKEEMNVVMNYANGAGSIARLVDLTCSPSHYNCATDAPAESTAIGGMASISNCEETLPSD